MRYSDILLPGCIAGLSLLACGSDGAQSANVGGAGGADNSTQDTSSSDDPWTSVAVPEATGPASPLSCEALEQGNCWKAAADSALSCAPSGEGTISEDGLSCSFPEGSRVVFADSLWNYGGYTFVDHTVLDANGEECLSQKGVAWGDFALRTPASTVFYDSLSSNSVRIVCGDGTSLSTEAGTCDDVGVPLEARPSYYLYGSTDEEPYVFSARLSGSSRADGETVLWRCAQRRE